MKKALFIFIIGFLVYFFSWYLVFLLGVNALSIQSEDTVPALFIPFAVIKEHTLNLDTYYPQMLQRYPQPDDKNFQKGLVPFYVKKVGSHYLSAFTIVTPILVLPVFIIAIVLGATTDWVMLAVLGHISGAVIMALSGVVFYYLCRNVLFTSEKGAKIATFVFMFATINYALISQAMWQHGTLELFLLFGMFYLYSSPFKRKSMFLAGIFFSLAILSRPTGVLSVGLLLGSFVLSKIKSPKKLIASCFFWVLGILGPLLFFVWYNNTFYGDISNQGYSSQLFSNWLGNFPWSFFGVWVSPSKGILVYSPVLIFSLLGFYIWSKKHKSTNTESPYLLFGFIALLHTIIISFWKHWYGGWSFGYRMSSDVIPFLVLGLVPYIDSPYFEKTKKLFYISLVLSVMIELFGIVTFDGIWHAAYDLGFNDTSWLWSLVNSEFAFNIRRVLVKLGLLMQACAKCQ